MTSFTLRVPRVGRILCLTLCRSKEHLTRE